MKSSKLKIESGGRNNWAGFHTPKFAACRSGQSGFKNGFSLIEVTIAIGIAVFCMVSLFGLSATGLSSNNSALEQTAAAGFARAIASDLRVTGTNGSSPIYGITSASGTSTFYLAQDGSATAINSGPDLSSRYRASIFIVAPPAGQRMATTARILITWPALADPVPGTLPKNFSGSFEVITALDRN